MKKKNCSQREKVLITGLIAVGIFTMVSVASMIYWQEKYFNLDDNNYCVPQGYSGVYYRLDSSGAAIVVLDTKDRTQAQIAAQIDAYMNARFNSIINNTQGGAE